MQRIGCLFAVLVMMSLGWPVKNPAQHTLKRKLHSRSINTYRGLRLSISLDRRSYRLRDTATVMVTLENVGGVPITIYKKLGWGCFGNFGFGLEDANGTGLMATYIPGSFYGPPFLRDDFITLMPGQTLRTERDFEIGSQEGIAKPGIYRAVVWYNSPVPREFAPARLDIWPMENGRLFAKRIRFIVTR